jgi:tripartite ATP-independent transporter DctM subunit
MHILTMVALVFIFMFANVPIAVALGLAALLYVVAVGLPIELVVQRMVYGMDNFILIAIPFFMLAGQLMNTGGITNRLFRFANALVGHLTGGLAQVNIIGSLIFAGMSGSAQADVAGPGAIEMKAMVDRGYDKEFSIGITAASSMIGPIIPPSIGFVIYGAIAGVSVGALFVGGVLPGFFIALTLMVMVHVMCRKRNYPKNPRASFGEVLIAFREALLPLFTPVFIAGGIILGIVTPTEGAVVAVIYSFILGVFFYREIKWKDLPDILLRTAVVTSMVMFIVSTASLSGWLLSHEQVPAKLTVWLASLFSSKIAILLAINGLILVLGCVMESVAILVMTIPVLMPICAKFGIDTVHFGVVLLVNIGVGMLTPPLGMILFILQGITGLPLGRVIRGVLPFLIPMMLSLIILTLWDQIVLFLPNLFIK